MKLLTPGVQDPPSVKAFELSANHCTLGDTYSNLTRTKSNSLDLKMFLTELNCMSLLETALTSVVSVILLLVASHQLWSLRWHNARDRGCKLPLPKGSMGWPFFGETLHWLIQGSAFHSSRREKYGNVFKTHLLGKPVIRVTGAENIRKILMGEHNLVSSQWPQSTQIILGSNTLVNSIGELHRQKRKIMAKVFSHSALESYLPRIQEAVSCELHGWCRDPGSTSVFPSAKTLTFRIAARILLGLSLAEQQFQEMAKVFEQLVENLFSLPLDIPFSGLRKGIKARDTLHRYMEEAIKQKLAAQDPDVCEDALDYLINSAKENGRAFSMQELKESAIELIFAAFFTTASASTSLILLLMKHPSAIQKIRQELLSQGLLKQCQCLSPPENRNNNIPSHHPNGCAEDHCQTSGCHMPLLLNSDGQVKTIWKPTQCMLADKTDREHLQLVSRRIHNGMSWVEKSCGPTCTEDTLHRSPSCNKQPGDLQELCSGCSCNVELSLDRLKELHYLDYVVKEVLRLLPPVSGGYRTAMQTFELDGYQIPKGWSVLYSIRDTHETAEVYKSSELFDPERFSPERNEGKAGRFNYIPFGGGVRSCIGKELAQIILKILAVELVATAKWELATPNYPKMQTVPIVHPVDGLHVFFNFLSSNDSDQASKLL
ncbi:cytochrome P450 26C1 [Spea bombifrons]|uniref:cytochrome P450 26C1 n=1 Tax=Spea bombifrons TaxID=233779 RepID=UPI00234BA27B|nr:cytochrome P450 26C1 [Spea bombifrons]